MGKKRIIQKSADELLSEKEKLDKVLKKQSVAGIARKAKNGRMYILSSYNNTIISLTDIKGDILGWTSAGSLGFKGARKATPFAASKVAEVIIQKAQKAGVNQVKVFVKGLGSGRSSALRSLANKGLNITAIEDITPIPHNGCRPRKPRRT
ncbi:MAG: 30S ribosomal protein S11 [Candidatus Pacebacteria bacterium]|nr:30S ribosomal protein S11 [Candidatus Paceibacterota bacterium]